MRRLNFGLVGCGKIAARHAEHIVRCGQLAGACDILKDRAEEFAVSYRTKAYYSIEEMLSAAEIDVVSICTPNGLHAQHSILALNAGCHVLCEKPMSTSVADCERMIEASQKNNRKLFIVKQNRFNPAVAALKKLLDESGLGRILSFQINCFWNRSASYYKNSWKGSLDLDGGSLYTQFSHFIDIMYWLLGDVEDINAFLANRSHQELIQTEDTGVAIIKMNSGVLGTINYTVNSFEQNMEGSITLFGEFGTIKIGGGYLNSISYQKIRGRNVEAEGEEQPPNNYGDYKGSMSNHGKVYDNLVNVLEGSGYEILTPFDALKTVEIIERIYKAAKFGIHA